MSQNISSVFMFKTVLGFTSLVLCCFMFLNRKYPDNFRKFTTQHTTKADGIIYQARRHVTKSLSELGTMQSLSDHILMLNFIPDTGSELIVLLLQKLQGRNNFKHVRLKNTDTASLDPFEQEAMIDEISEVIRSNAIPLTMDRKMYFLNFTRYGKQSPKYLSIVRNPLDIYFARFHKSEINRMKPTQNISQIVADCFLYGSKECFFEDQQEFEFIINYFCGQDPRCKLLNNEWALARAKSSVDRYFPVVGIFEDLNSTVKMLERKMNYFFKGVTELYGQQLFHSRPRYSKYKRPKLEERYEEYLQYSLRNELTFYQWIVSRLQKQIHRQTA